jgi:hypothetical protein
MATIQSSSRHPQRTFWRRFRLPWQRVNTITGNAQWHNAWHYDQNYGPFLLPANEPDRLGRERFQRIIDTDAQTPLGDDRARDKSKGEGIAIAGPILEHALMFDHESDPPNQRSAFMEQATSQVAPDAKDDSDWMALRPNKGVMPRYEPQTDLAKRMLFTIHLIQQGIYNEGFNRETMPDYYRQIERRIFDGILNSSDDLQEHYDRKMEE